MKLKQLAFAVTLIHAAGLSTSQVVTYTNVFTVGADAGAPLRATLAWSDYPGSLISLTKLVNGQESVTIHAGDQVGAIGLTNQRETTLLWDRRTGRPLHRAIVWQDRRTADICARLKAEGAEPDVAARTGLPLVATNEPFFPDRAMHTAHDALLCIAEESDGDSTGGNAVSFIAAAVLYVLAVGRWLLDRGNARAT